MAIFGKKKEKNINLIPKEQAETAFSKKDLVVPILIPVLTIGIIVLVFASLFTLEQREVGKAKDLEQKITEKITQWQKFSDEAKVVKKIGVALGLYKEGVEQSKFLGTSTRKVRNAIPTQVKLTKYSVDEEGNVSISGISQNPTSIFQLFEKLKKQEEDFSNVELHSISYQSGGDASSNQQGEEGFIFAIEFGVKKDEKKNN